MVSTAPSRRPDTKLRQAHGIVDKVTSFISFSAIVIYVLDLKASFGQVDWSKSAFEIVQSLRRAGIPILRDKGWALALAATTLIWLLRYKRASRNEIEIIVSCFSRYVPLPEWRTLHGSRMLRALAAGLITVFLVLAALVPYIEIFALVVFVWAIGDLLGNSAIQKNLLSLFRDKRFDPPDDDPFRETILRRRAVAEQYWLGRPQLVRITLFLAVTGVCIILTGSILTEVLPFRRETAYGIMIAAILANTAVMGVWRYYRDLDLALIEQDEAVILETRARRA